jgi:hypothetical protein
MFAPANAIIARFSNTFPLFFLANTQGLKDIYFDIIYNFIYLGQLYDAPLSFAPGYLHAQAMTRIAVND